ncbi:hypothetical protein PIB30_074559 [Stylosanthes scabra]|uniref:Uncharacterized protein n=1 Tax=Stylosanthes scabra TaxID=79078 RepID=A0ABU6VPQ6_9FABA|nr:hypothetical protein [Stylosanthes scabra]
MAEEELIERLKKPDTAMVQKGNKAIRMQTTTTIGTTIIKTKGTLPTQERRAVEAVVVEEEETIGMLTIIVLNAKSVAN